MMTSKALVRIVGCTLALLYILRPAESNWFLSGHIAEVAERNTVIILQATCGYLAFTTNCVNSLLKVRAKNFLVIAEDEKAYDYMVRVYPNHVISISDILTSPDAVTGEYAEFMSKQFRAITNQRAQIWLEILNLGYNVLAIDSDMVLLKNPMTTLPLMYDMLLIGDSWQGDDGPDFDEEDSGSICTCFLYMKPTPGLMEMLEEFREENANSFNPWEQRDFGVVFRSRDWNFTHYILPRRTHPPGFMVRLEGDIRQNKFGARPHISHANAIGGYEDKVRHFEKQGLWEPNQDLPVDCSGGTAHARAPRAHAARHSAGAQGNRHGGAAGQEGQEGREPKHLYRGKGSESRRT